MRICTAQITSSAIFESHCSSILHCGGSRTPPRRRVECVHMSRIGCICEDVLPVCRRVPRASCMSCGTCAPNVMSCACISLCPCLQLFCSTCPCHCAAVPHRLCLSLSSILRSLVAMASSPASSRTRGSSGCTPCTQSTVMESSCGSFNEEALCSSWRQRPLSTHALILLRTMICLVRLVIMLFPAVRCEPENGNFFGPVFWSRFW